MIGFRLKASPNGTSSVPYLTYRQMNLWFMMPNPPQTDMGRISKKEPTLVLNTNSSTHNLQPLCSGSFI